MPVISEKPIAYALGPCRLCGNVFCADLAWLASISACGSSAPAECPRCDPLSFEGMPWTPQPWDRD